VVRVITYLCKRKADNIQAITTTMTASIQVARTDNDSQESKKQEYCELQPTRSIAEAEVHTSQDDTRNGEFHRSFSPRKVHASVVSLK
jgi:hypothetical protein